MVCAVCCHMELVLAVMYLYNAFLLLFLLLRFYNYFKSGFDKLDRMVDDTSMSQPYVLFVQE